MCDQLRIIEAVLHKINATMNRMPEKCDPYLYYSRLRPYTHGWKDNPALPNGLPYEGVQEHANQSMQFKGDWLRHDFRTAHFRYAADYINKQSPTSIANPADVGTGGTPFMEYLKKHLDETEQHLLQ